MVVGFFGLSFFGLAVAWPLSFCFFDSFFGSFFALALASAFAAFALALTSAFGFAAAFALPPPLILPDSITGFASLIFVFKIEKNSGTAGKEKHGCPRTATDL